MGKGMRVVVVGGLAAGPKAAAKIKRMYPDAHVTIVEKGRYLSFGSCGFPYFIEGEVKDISDLMKTPTGVVRDAVYFKSVKDIEARTQSMVVAIDRENRQVVVRDMVTSNIYKLPYDYLVLATGARPVVPPLEGVTFRNVFQARTPEDAMAIDRFLGDNPGVPVVVVGGGAIGVEMAEAFTLRGARVTLVEMLPQILPPLEYHLALMVQRHLESQGVRVMTGTRVLRFEDDGEGYVARVVTDRGELEARMVLMSVGVRPNTELARECGLKLGETGAIKVNDRMQTSDPRIYAVGDCVETVDLVTGKKVFMPLGSTANKQGRVAAINICGGDARFPGVTGTLILKAFDYNVARTGLTVKQAKDAGFDPISVTIAGPDKPEFMPQARPLLVELVADRDTGRILGAQCVGPGDANKRIDVAASLLYFKATLWDAMGVDLAYAPPYAPAVDNIAKAAWALENKLQGRMDGITSVELKEKLDKGEDLVVLDVRAPWECQELNLSCPVVNIPLGQLRRRLGDLPRDREIVALCKSGQRGYEAYTILKAHGFQNVKVLEGGLLAWPFGTEAKETCG